MGTLTWSRPEPPRPPDGDCTVRVVPEALVTGFARAPLVTIDPPRRSMVGAVHDADGALVRASQRVWSQANPGAPIAADPRARDLTTLDPDGQRLPGRWLYAGHWTRHFGHFLVETLPVLWPDPDTVRPDAEGSGRAGVAGILAHRSFRGGVATGPGSPARVATIPPWQRELLDLAGWGDLPVRLVGRRDLRVEELVVATRPLVFRAFAHPEAVGLWQRVGRRAAERRGPTPSSRRVFWSRTGFNQSSRPTAGTVPDRTSPAWDAHLDQVFAAAGFTVVRPETLEVTEQVALARGAEVLAGSSGSALHLSAVATPGCRVIEVGDSRSPQEPQSSQVMIDAAIGRECAFVPYEDASGLARFLAAL